MLHFSIKEDGPIPHLGEVIARQKAEGGYIIAYMRSWSFVVVSQSQVRVAHVPFGHNRVLPGVVHSLFTLFLGIWSLHALFGVPMILILNTRGGMDITANHSTRSVDPMRDLPPTPGQGERDLKVAQWIFVGLAGTGLLLLFWHLSQRYPG